MGSLFSTPKPPAIPIPPPAAHPPTLGSAQIATDVAAQKRKEAGAVGQGFEDTLQTSPEGLKPQTPKVATLLGQ